MKPGIRRHDEAQDTLPNALPYTPAPPRRPHLGTQQAHAEHIQRLALHVLLAHVHHALQARARAHCGLQMAQARRRGEAGCTCSKHKTVATTAETCAPCMGLPSFWFRYCNRLLQPPTATATAATAAQAATQLWLASRQAHAGHAMPARC